MTIALEPHAEGTILPVRAQAAARKNEIRGSRAGMLKISVTQAAEKGKANKAIVAILAKQLGLRKSQVAILSGATSPHKRFLIRGLPPDQLDARIQPYLAE